jgi:hypothetical protein
MRSTIRPYTPLDPNDRIVGYGQIRSDQATPLPAEAPLASSRRNIVSPSAAWNTRVNAGGD